MPLRLCKSIVSMKTVKEHYLACKIKYLTTKTHFIFDCAFNFNFASLSTEWSEWHKVLLTKYIII